MTVRARLPRKGAVQQRIEFLSARANEELQSWIIGLRRSRDQ